MGVSDYTWLPTLLTLLSRSNICSCDKLTLCNAIQGENVILLGLMPGPHEPAEHDINSFLEPLVSEQLKFWDGRELNICNSGGKVVQCALLGMV